MLLLAAGACLLATSAQAQTPQAQPAPAAGRYLTWANRPATTTPGEVIAAQAEAAAAQARVRESMIPRRVAPSQAGYRPMLQPTAASRLDPRGLMPASAWLGPQVAPTYAPNSPNPIAYAAIAAPAPAPVPAPAPAPAPTYAPPPMPAERFAPQPQPQPVAPVADPMAPRADAPVFSSQRPAASDSVTEPAFAPPATTDAADPMAPRRDARIFQMQQDTPQGSEQAALSTPAPASVQSGQSGARYYSVHRNTGQRPDPTALPEPVYYDSVAIDLAEPPVHEAPTRDAQGRRRVVANPDPSLP